MPVIFLHTLFLPSGLQQSGLSLGVSAGQQGASWVALELPQDPVCCGDVADTGLGRVRLGLAVVGMAGSGSQPRPGRKRVPH